jgi:hypothetical protein
VIVPQKPSKPLLAANRRQHAGPFVLLGGEQQEVVLSLMVPLGTVMCRELLESSPERAFSWLFRRWRSVFRRHGDQDSEAMPITCSELMAIRSERSDAGLLHPALR